MTFVFVRAHHYDLVVANTSPSGHGAAPGREQGGEIALVGATRTERRSDGIGNGIGMSESLVPEHVLVQHREKADATTIASSSPVCSLLRNKIVYQALTTCISTRTTKLRRICHQALPSLSESIHYRHVSGRGYRCENYFIFSATRLDDAEILDVALK